MFTYYLRDGLKSKEEVRQAGEKEKIEADEDISFPGWEAVADEMAESDPRIWIIVKDSAGNTVRRVSGPVGQGMNRVAWDLRHPASRGPGAEIHSFVFRLRAVGTAGRTRQLFRHPDQGSGRRDHDFEPARPVRSGTAERGCAAGELTLPKPPRSGVPTRIRSGLRPPSAAALGTELARVEAMKKALSRSTAAPGELDERLDRLRTRLKDLEDELLGNRAKLQVGEKTSPNVGSRLSAVELGVYQSTYGPTATLRKTLEIADAQLREIQSDLEEARAEATALGEDLLQAGAPWVEGSPLP